MLYSCCRQVSRQSRTSKVPFRAYLPRGKRDPEIMDGMPMADKYITSVCQGDTFVYLIACRPREPRGLERSVKISPSHFEYLTGDMV